MDMSGMSAMGGMGGSSGHDMSGMTMSGGIFTSEDEAIARGFWYGVAGFVGLLMLVRAASVLETRRRLRNHLYGFQKIASRPHGRMSQIYATATTVARELLYPQPVHFTGRITKYFTPLPVGKWLFLAVYWTIILCLLWSNTILKPSDPMYAYKWEKVGFRAAWVTISQIPLVYLLSCKFNPITLLTGISYERFNWLHRWVSRTVFLTTIVHWSFFFTEWSIADIVKMEIQLMPMVKYGFGAWGIITWMVLTGFGFFRDVGYELFVAQHIAAAAVLLWVLFVHVPTYAQYNIWMSVGFLVFDWGARIVWGALRNTHALGRTGLRRPGYAARLEHLPGDMVRLTIDRVDFDWRAGQHVYITLPGLRPLETHPFTIANPPQLHGEKSLKLWIRARSGFSRSLYKAAAKNAGTDRTYRTFISGPWGSPPDCTQYDTLVLVACASGFSFILPVLQDTLRRRGYVRDITLHWIIKNGDQFEWFRREIFDLLEVSEDPETNLTIHLHITHSITETTLVMKSISDLPESLRPENRKTASTESASVDSSNSSRPDSDEVEEKPLSPPRRRYSRPYLHPNLWRYSGNRPKPETLIRPYVERALGETAVVVCGGLSINAEIRTYVAKLSDERAVHKGTGAQGIYLFTETYGW